MATADTEPVTVEAREAWFREFDSKKRPLWVHHGNNDAEVDAWLSLRSFYGRPAYHATVEIAFYVDPKSQRRGIGRRLLTHACEAAPGLGIHTFLAFVFAHNTPSIALLASDGFTPWGLLPRIAELDSNERDVAIFGRRVA